MSKAAVERRLSQVLESIGRARRELEIADEQLAVMQDEAEELRIRALVAETPLAGIEYEEAERHAGAMKKSRDAVAASLAELLILQDALLTKWDSEAS